MELEYTIFYLSPNAFSYIISTDFLQEEYEVSWLIT